MPKKTKKSPEYKFEWTVIGCSGLSSVNGMQNFITDVTYEIIVTDADRKSAKLSSIVGFSIPEKKPKDYVTHSKVTNKKVLKWIQEVAGKEVMEAGAVALLKRANPPTMKNLSPKK